MFAALTQGVETVKEPKLQNNCDPKTGKVKGKIEIGEFKDLQTGKTEKMACPPKTCDDAKDKQTTVKDKGFKAEKTSFSKRIKKVGNEFVCDKIQVAEKKGAKPMEFKYPTKSMPELFKDTIGNADTLPKDLNDKDIRDLNELANPDESTINQNPVPDRLRDFVCSHKLYKNVNCSGM